MTYEMKQNITHQFKTQITSTTILISLRLNDNNDSEDFISKNRSIYNVKAILKRKTLSSLTSNQAFMKFLNKAEYHLQYEKNEINQITRLFFFKNSFQYILKINHDILLINCTYKTNKYRLSLLIIYDVTAISIFFT